jgi:hypothetical protein
VDQLGEEAPELANQLMNIGRLLDAGNFSDAFRDNAKDDSRNVDDIVQERRRLVSQWEGLVERVRCLPQFKYFLLPVPFHELRQALLGGQVVILNASKFAVDALIFGTASSIKHVSLPNTNLEMITELSSNIVLQQPTKATATQQRKYNTFFLKPAL